MEVHTPLVYGLCMALIDVFSLSLLKGIHLGLISKTLRFLAVIVYGMQPLIFLASLNFETLTVMNLLWDVMSDVLVSIVGLYFFKEQLSSTKKLGVILSLVAIFLLSYEEKN
jgi:multidrug transporter EmrE-like cation transporter